MICPACQRESPDEARVCAQCGAWLGRACPRCARRLRPDARFCDGCGQTVGGLAAPGGREPRAYTPRHLAERILTQRSALEGERKQVTVLFADVKGSTELAARLDPEAWHRVLERFFAILTDGVHRFEGTINQYTGDGVMALFGAPVAHEDHALRACYAALRLIAELGRHARELGGRHGVELPVRMGLNSGEVVVGKIGDDLRMDYTAQGHAVALAARVEEVAEPGSAWLTERTARLVEGFVALRDLGPLTLRGVAEPVRAYALEAPGPLRTRLDASRARGFSRLVGREAELGRLEAALDRAQEGMGRVVGIVGDAGVGKSRLALEFAERSRARGVAVYAASCPAHGATLPFHAARELLRSHFGVAADTPDEAARGRIAERLLALDRGFESALPLAFDFLGVAAGDAPGLDAVARQRALAGLVRRLVQARSADEPALLLVDDAHWIDPESDALLAELVDALGWTRTLLAVNFRPEYRAAWMQVSYYEAVRLEPLAGDAVDALLGELLGSDPSLRELAVLLRGRAGGNPFFVEELVRELARAGALEGERGAYRLARPVAEVAVPETVRAALAARIDRLGELEKQVLQAAAVIGARFDLELLERLAELPREDLLAALASLGDAQLVHEESLYPRAEYAFHHPLTQEVVYGAQLTERRGELHKRVAVALEELHAERLGEWASLIAHHWDAAGVHALARRWRHRAALRVAHIQVPRRDQRDQSST